MCVTNLAAPQPDHVHVMARFAFEMIAAANETLINEDDSAMGYVQIRV